MNRLAAILVLTLTLPLTARADEASHRAKAKEMMELLHSEQVVEAIAANLKKQLPDVAASVVGTSPTPVKKEDAQNFIRQAEQIIDTQLSWSILQPAFTDIYVKNFTEEQLDGIIAFYKSPAGLAMLTIMPTINTQVQAYGNQKITDMKPQLQKLYESFRQSEGIAAPPIGIGSAPPIAPSAPAAPAAKPPAAPK